MQISTKDWNNYIKMLSQLNEMAGALMSDYVTRYGFDNRDALIDYAYGLVTTYGEGSAALAAEMYDETAAMFGKVLPRAEVAETADYNEVAKAINGTIKHSANPKSCGNTVNRLVKRAGADTTLKNAQRDGAQFAWVPMGDTCAFCITLASNGFQYMSKKALRNGHAEHIHANCDCAYTVRFDTKSGVKGYDPDKYLAMYNGAEGKNSKEKINSLRRMRYEDPAVRAKINAQKREAYADKHRMDYRHERDVNNSIEAIAKEGKIIAKQIIGSPNGIYVSDALTVKPKKLQEIENNITEAKRIIGVKGKEEPKIVIVADTELGKAGGRYDAKTNTIYYKVIVDKKLQKHVNFHELYHWDDGQSYIREGHIVKNNQEVIDYASAKAKRILDKMGINADNVSEINDFCERLYHKGRYDEVYTDIRTLRSLR